MKRSILLLCLCLSCFIQHPVFAETYHEPPIVSRPHSRPSQPKFPTVNTPYQGCFIERTFGDKQMRTATPKACRIRRAPCSTFKIVLALLALQSGVVSDPKETFRWDRKKKRYRSWNRDHDLRMALHTSAPWVFDIIAKRLGRTRIQHWVKRLRYGNQDYTAKGKAFLWKGSLKISPQEQLTFIYKLYRGDLPLKKSVQRQVRQMLFEINKPGLVFGGKTGTGYHAGKYRVGWFVGYAEYGKEKRVFVTQVHGGPRASGFVAKRESRRMLRQLGHWPKHRPRLRKKP